MSVKNSNIYFTGARGGNSDETSEADDLGGLRITTFMIYLNNVQAGGNTIFPQVKSYTLKEVTKILCSIHN